MTTTTVIVATEQPVAHVEETPERRRSWLVLAVVCTAQLMLALDATVVNVALPKVQTALGFADADRHWVVTAYSLAFGSLLLVGGRLADTFGRKRVFLTGLVGFAGASAIGGVARDFPMLVAARALQGGFGSLLAPSALSLLAVTFTEPRARVRAFGVFGAVSAVGGSVGLMLGGMLTEYASWRCAMYINVFFALAGLLGAAPTLAPDRDRRRYPGSDLTGATLAVTGVFAVVYGISRARTAQGMSAFLNVQTLSLIAGGVGLLVAFVLVERHATDALLPLRVVLDRDRGGAFAAMFLSAIAVFGILLFLTYYLETTLGYPPIKTGLAFLPMAATMVLVGSGANAALGTRTSPRTRLPTGLLVAGVGVAMLTRISAEPHYASTVLPATLVTAVGLGLVFAPCFELGTSGVEESDAGIASATIHVSQQIGGSIGIALLNAIATAVAKHSVAGAAPGLTARATQAQAAVHSDAVAFSVCAGALVAAAIVVGALLHWPRFRLSSPSRRSW